MSLTVTSTALKLQLHFLLSLFQLWSQGLFSISTVCISASKCSAFCTLPLSTHSQPDGESSTQHVQRRGNCHFADDTQLKVTFKEKTNGFRYYICPLSCMWYWAHHPFILAQGCRTSYTDRNCGSKNAERQQSSTSASKWSDYDSWSAISTFGQGALS